MTDLKFFFNSPLVFFCAFQFLEQTTLNVYKSFFRWMAANLHDQSFSSHSDQPESVSQYTPVSYWMNVLLFPVSNCGGISSGCNGILAGVALSAIEQQQQKSNSVDMVTTSHYSNSRNYKLYLPHAKNFADLRCILQC